MQNTCDKISYVMQITDVLQSSSVKLRSRWMRVNKHLTVHYKTGKLMQRLFLNRTYKSFI